MFHINLLTPYRETITHGPNYQHPPPDLVNNEEEYEVEKILDSRLFSRRKRLQYLVKWAGYPDAENMWVNKDDVFAEDKVREFKNSNPKSRTHIRRLQTLEDSHHPLDSPNSSNGSYFLPRTLSMTSHVDDPFQSTTPPLSSIHDNLPATTPLSEAASEFPDDHNSDYSIREAIRLLRIGGTPTESASESDHRNLSIPVPNRLVGHEDGQGVASGAAAPSAVEAGSLQQGEGSTGYDSDNPLYQPDMQPCLRGCGPREYCHGHSPMPSMPPPLRVRPWGDNATGMVDLSLSCEEAVALVNDLSALIQAVDENTPTIPLAYTPQRVGVR